MKTFVMAVLAVVVLAGCYDRRPLNSARHVADDGCAPYRVDAGKITAACS